MDKLNRRTLLKVLGAAPAAAGFTWTEAEAAQAAKSQAARRTGAKPAAFKPKFFTAHEWATVNLLVDIIIPKDERSGSATDAGVPEFMDFMMSDQPGRQTAMRGGLRWIDAQCEKRYDKRFLECTEAERTAVLDDIAWPQKAKPEFLHGVTFFNSFRDLTAAGFWSSKMGVIDLEYTGNTMMPEWPGCPPEALKKLGVG
ncbi:MAG TPA: gluconate 2-dehydrogenase subunit 3 family protein [Vicinamibacterales bacterium]|nr:gluconate 2-dehydrogenase subunit 3 family protein [Vicinamibacterales bacterium]